MVIYTDIFYTSYTEQVSTYTQYTYTCNTRLPVFTYTDTTLTMYTIQNATVHSHQTKRYHTLTSTVTNEMFIPYTHKQLQLMADNTHVHTLTTQNNIRYTGDAYISPI